MIVIFLAGLAFYLAALHVPPRSARALLAATPGASNIEAAWVQIIPLDPSCEETRCDAQALLRVVLPESAGDCVGAARDVTTNLPLTLRARVNPNPSMFPILLCEVVLPISHPGVRLADGTKLGWSRLNQKTPHRAAILGDSGCDFPKQDCTRTLAWPLPRIAMQAAWMDEGDPDLVVHVGDFRYRGKDDWSSWYDDFFAPARPLLAAAPWVMVRGNHDNCHEDKGDGWIFLFEPTPYEMKPCNPSQLKDEPRIEQPYALDLGDLRAIVLDTADARYRCERYRKIFEQDYVQHFQSMLDGAARGPGSAVWLVSHYPAFDTRTPPNASCTLGGIIAEKITASAVQTILSGDQHSFLYIPIPRSMGTSLLQLVIGNSGTLLNVLPGNPGHSATIWCKATFPQAPSGTVVQARPVYGYVAAVRSGKEWQFDLRTIRSADQQETGRPDRLEPCEQRALPKSG